jgi:ribulose-phosphate 3-epimerase
LKISVSIYSSNRESLPDLIRELDGHTVDYFHIDCKDDVSVFEDIKVIRQVSAIPIDLHIISNEPEKFYPLIIENKVELVTFQYENLKEKLNIPAEIKSKLGLAIISETGIEAFEPYKDRFDFILFMATVPGKSGKSFDKGTFKKIRQFGLKYPDKKIYVDGGVNADLSFVLRNMGVYSIVSGSYIFNSPVIGEALHKLRNPFHVPKDLLVSDIMIGREETPTLPMENISFASILKHIDDYNLGYTLIADPDDQLAGFVTNADVRKGLLRHLNDLNAIQPADIINKNPFKIYDDFSISEMLDFVRNAKIIILYLPVVDRNNKIKGSITFTNLIKGE